MPSWKKVIVSGSDASLNSLNITAGITGSLLGTASFATTATIAATASTITTQGASSGGTHYFLISTDNINSGPITTTVRTSNVTFDSTSKTLAVTASWATSSISAQTASYVQTAQTASYVLQAVSASFATSASRATTASFAVSASWAPGGVGGVTQIIAGTNVTISPIGGTGAVTINSSGTSGSSFPYTGSAQITGSLDVYGSVLVTGSLFVSQSLDTSARILYDSSGVNTSIDWENREAVDASTYVSINWNARTLQDTTSNTSIDWQNRTLASTNGSISLDWSNDTLIRSQLYQLNDKSIQLQDVVSNTINDPLNSYLGDIIAVDGSNTFMDGTVTDGMLVYLGTDATWYPVTQNSTTATKMLGIAFMVHSGAGSILLDGHVVITDTGTGGPHVTGADHGLPIYIEDNTTTGQMSTTLPTTTGGNHVVRVLGHCYWQNQTTTSQWMMKFRPSNDWITI